MVFSIGKCPECHHSRCYIQVMASKTKVECVCENKACKHIWFEDVVSGPQADIARSHLFEAYHGYCTDCDNTGSRQGWPHGSCPSCKE